VEGKEADARSDIFSLEAVLYEMVTAKRAFVGKTTASTIAAILAAEPKPISTIQPMLPPALEHVTKVCLAKDPAERLQTAHEVKVALQWIAQSGSQSGVPAHTLAARTSWHRVTWLLASLLLLVVTGGSAAWWLGAHRTPPPMGGQWSWSPIRTKPTNT
jgi:serine/threonine protein kinase